MRKGRAIERPGVEYNAQFGVTCAWCSCGVSRVVIENIRYSTQSAVLSAVIQYHSSRPTTVNPTPIIIVYGTDNTDRRASSIVHGHSPGKDSV